MVIEDDVISLFGSLIKLKHNRSSKAINEFKKEIQSKLKAEAIKKIGEERLYLDEKL